VGGAGVYVRAPGVRVNVPRYPRYRARVVAPWVSIW
jgi:hypothetical protein